MDQDTDEQNEQDTDHSPEEAFAEEASSGESESPEDLVAFLASNPKKVPDQPQKTDAATKRITEQYAQADTLRQLQEIHSYATLETSRSHSLTLLQLLPDFNKTEMATKCLAQEINLQEYEFC